MNGWCSVFCDGKVRFMMQNHHGGIIIIIIIISVRRFCIISIVIFIVRRTMTGWYNVDGDVTDSEAEAW